MTQHYSDPDRETDPHALPDLEVFYADDLTDAEGEALEAGWFYWFCLPGCLPDSDPCGPYKTEGEALEAARDE